MTLECPVWSFFPQVHLQGSVLVDGVLSLHCNVLDQIERKPSSQELIFFVFQVLYIEKDSKLQMKKTIIGICKALDSAVTIVPVRSP